MTDYRCYFFGTDNRIVDRADFTADTDALAIIEARALYAEGEFRTGSSFGNKHAVSSTRKVRTLEARLERGQICEALDGLSSEFGKPHAEAQSRAPPRN